MIGNFGISCRREVCVIEGSLIMITFDCPKCGRNYKVPDEHGGREVLCKGCKVLIDIPQYSTKHETWFDSNYDTSRMFMDKNHDLLQALLKQEREAPPIETA